ncbi:MAG: hypothetical protein JXB07_02975 [Anaerolineae bacterium]|nr:hypothetical protein [Anaerolineae bacterium]
MSNEENRKLEQFIQDWHWDEKSHKFAQELGLYLFRFIDDLNKQGLSEKTVRKHTGNCWHIGILECQYGYKDRFSPNAAFNSPHASHEYEFRRKMGDSKYAIDSYQSTWKKLYQYTQSLRHSQHGP